MDPVDPDPVVPISDPVDPDSDPDPQHWFWGLNVNATLFLA